MPWQHYSNRSVPADWNARKRHVHERDGSVCYVCGHDQADQVDHKLAVAHGGTHELDNLACIHGDRCPTCGKGCHAAKTQREAAQGRATVRAKARHPRPRKHPGLN